VDCPVERVTSGPAEHFFGYYDKTPWSPDGTSLLGLRVLGDVVQVGLVDRGWRAVGETAAWNWQQGAMAQWLGESAEVVFNTRSGSAVVDVASGARRDLPLPVYAVAPDGRRALSVDFGRLASVHETIGYAGASARGAGIDALDLVTGETELLVSLAALAAFEPHPAMAGAEHWVSHLAFDPAGARVVFLHRWSHEPRDESAWWHRLIVMDAHGGELRALETTDGMISHPTWRPDGAILVWSTHDGRTAYHLYADTVERLGDGVLTENGHCTYGPDGRWLLTDTYPDADGVQTLILYEPATGTRVDVGRFAAAPGLDYHARCDLHPRWSRDGMRVCIDATHEGSRQMYVVEVSSVTRRGSGPVAPTLRPGAGP
jgi:hypothetical protein